MRIRLTLRNKMFLFFSVIMPFGFFFLYAGVFAKGDPRAVRFFLGPVISLAVMGSFWGLSAALVTFREQGILRRFHVTPVTCQPTCWPPASSPTIVLTLPTVAHRTALRSNSSFTSPTSAICSLSSSSSPSASFPSPPWASSSPASPTPCRKRKSSTSSFGSLDFSFRRDRAVALSPQVAQAFGSFLPATYLVWGLQAAIFFLHPSGSLWWKPCSARHLGHSRFFRCRAAFSLGARIQDPAQRQTLGRRHRLAFLSSSEYGKTARNHRSCNLKPLTAPSSAPPKTDQSPIRRLAQASRSRSFRAKINRTTWSLLKRCPAQTRQIGFPPRHTHCAPTH